MGDVEVIFQLPDRAAWERLFTSSMANSTFDRTTGWHSLAVALRLDTRKV